MRGHNATKARSLTAGTAHLSVMAVLVLGAKRLGQATPFQRPCGGIEVMGLYFIGFPLN